MFVFKRTALFFSMILLSNIGDMPNDSKSFFISWFIFLLLLVLEYIESFKFKRQDKNKKASIFYGILIVVFGILTIITFLGSFGLILVSENFILEPNSEYILMNGLFSVLFGNTISIYFLIYFIAASVTISFALEGFFKPVLSYNEKHKIKYSNKGEVAS